MTILSPDLVKKWLADNETMSFVVGRKDRKAVLLQERLRDLANYYLQNEKRVKWRHTKGRRRTQTKIEIPETAPGDSSTSGDL